MAPGTIRKALGAVKDQTTINLAKVGNGRASISDLEVTIVKATGHDEYPADEKHVREILSLTCYSRARISFCVGILSRRLGKTRNWTVALKTLILIQRLLADGDPAYEQEIFFATRGGTRLLNLSDFRDSSRSNPWDYSAFVRTYALYLDGGLEYRMRGRRGKHIEYGPEGETMSPPDGKVTPTQEMKIEQIFSRMHHLQQILERFLACKPTGGARDNRIVFIALYPIVKESFHIYYDLTEIIAILVERFMGLDIANCVKIYEFFERLQKQFEELDVFYCWCKNAGVARSGDYPEIEKITQKKLDVMDEFIKEKTALARGRLKESFVAHEEETPVPESPKEAKEKVDINEMKALPAPEEAKLLEEDPEPEHEEKNEEVQKEADLLNFGEDALTNEEHDEKLALALFDGGAQPTTTDSTASPWEPCNMADWEAALVESVSKLSNQRTALAGGFDMLLLDGMYQHNTANASMATMNGGGGSASSVALGSAGRPATLALPAPSTGGNGCTTAAGGGDPFAASVTVAPPSYVQMSDMERKQKLLLEEQLMWQQYARNGMQAGQVQVIGMTNQNSYAYNMGAYYHPRNY
ncbi:hypothetical protein MLD38_032178 [Melastoma candidum]|uniref:Uncharacterized protein n=1 Tax=Melastoma candidum TaxID=119954 RepID=A0ACB9M444_9MYRT|nr:hypothetical protein MLD38_032178 [Melastoma candidum]